MYGRGTCFDRLSTNGKFRLSSKKGIPLHGYRMCVVALSLDAHPKWRIILAGNRDEFHTRPSAPVARWDDADSHIVAGRDLVSDGTWLGVSELGRIAVVTNIRTDTPPDPAKASRGDLVTNYLRGKVAPDMAALDTFNAFSLITIGPEGATLSANRPSPMTMSIPAGVHGLSNGLPYEDWPRKSRLIEAFSEVINNADDLPEAMLDLLASESIDDSIFIRSDVYGTRCSTLALVDYQGIGLILERRFGPDAYNAETTEIRFLFTP
jgi:uncharacterized protein with NRDE domain